MQSFFVVGVAQLVEHQVVALVAAGSIPVTHPTKDLKSSRLAAFFILHGPLRPKEIYLNALNYQSLFTE